MRSWIALLVVSLFTHSTAFTADRPAEVEKALAKAKDNRPQLEAALDGVPKEQRKGMEFLVANMPDRDLTTLTADFLKANHALAYKAKQDVPWGKDIHEDVFFNNLLPYANIDEKRDPWRQEFSDLCRPIVKDCKTPTEVAMKLNKELYPKLALKYAPQRKAPNFSPKESIAQGTASCTGLSIVLSDACRAVGVPTRLVGTPNWSDKRGNHTWLEVWDKDWHFTGACEPDPLGLDRGWFVGDAAKAQKDNPEHAIYAASFRKTDQHFPLVWARDNKNVPGENVTDRYAKTTAKKADTVRVSIRVLTADKKRVAAAVTVSGGKAKFEGKSRSESADLNDTLEFDLLPATEYTVTVGDVTKRITTGKAGESQAVVVELNSK
ncbi:transglutaminase-like domain-containing protein [Limnoglobus roseus]|uniref:Transglutaminase domain-containing protein n=1 Tax=Limnoglobus roseus TaxID=2598579 RepID=A0A5C1ATV8_9BACT|nr:transglutaminase-like domain-containing protein [Limnoglobus roseus]QEL20208.1 transglutaminase domain-containing protein [Limnoglobus roseus]